MKQYIRGRSSGYVHVIVITRNHGPVGHHHNASVFFLFFFLAKKWRIKPRSMTEEEGTRKVYCRIHAPNELTNRGRRKSRKF